MRKHSKGFQSRMGSHFAGDGILKPCHDDVDNWETGNRYFMVKMPHEDEEEWKEMSGPVISYNIKEVNHETR